MLVVLSLTLGLMVAVKFLLPSALSRVLEKFSGLSINIDSVEFLNCCLSSITITDGKELELVVDHVKFEYSWVDFVTFKPFVVLLIDGVNGNVSKSFKTFNKSSSSSSKPFSRHDDMMMSDWKAKFDNLFLWLCRIFNHLPLKILDFNADLALEVEGSTVDCVIKSCEISVKNSASEDRVVMQADAVVANLKTEAFQVDLTFPEMFYCIESNATIRSENISCQVELAIRTESVNALLTEETCKSLKEGNPNFGKTLEFDMEKLQISMDSKYSLNCSMSNLSLMDGLCTVFALQSCVVQLGLVLSKIEFSRLQIQSQCFGVWSTSYCVDMESGCFCLNDQAKTWRCQSFVLSVPTVRDIVSIGYLNCDNSTRKLVASDLHSTLSPEDVNNALGMMELLPKHEMPTSSQASKPVLSVIELNNPFVQFVSPSGKEFCLGVTCEVLTMKIPRRKCWAIEICEIALIDSTYNQDIVETIDTLILHGNENSLKIVIKNDLFAHWYPHVQMFFLEWHSSISWEKMPNPKRPDKKELGLSLFANEAMFNFHFGSRDLLFRFSNVDLAKQGSCWSLQSSMLNMDFANIQEIIKVHQVTVTFKKNLTSWRLELEDKVDEANDCIEVCFVTFFLKFPYEFDVHHAFTQDVLKYWKWTKHILASRGHRRKKTISPDIIIYGKAVSIEIPDDSFEVRLRDNYELLEDEHFEAEKRRKCLREKIEELKASHIVLPHAKVEELYANLEKKNATIYVQRSINMQNKTKTRSSLMEVSFTALKCAILSDSSMSHQSQLKRFIQEVEKVSRMPPDLNFSTALLKWIRFECKLVLFRLRDFEQPFIDMSHVLLWGRLGLAEQVSQPRERSKNVVSVFHYGDYVIERGLQSLKVFSDLAVDMSYFGFAHGPCWEPVISQVSLAMGYITGIKKKDPSPPLIWWDKIRYFCHGRLLWSVKNLNIFFHTSLDPYNTTEEIELGINNGNLELSNNTVTMCEADSLEVFVRTASKYDDCRLLYFPKIKLTFFFDWCCMGHPNDHFGVILCTRDTLPEFSSFEEHDSYRAFRSHNVNVKIFLETKGSESLCSSIHMFSSTIRWLESLKWLFSGTSRPIRRGKIFGNETAKKKSLFRHLKEMGITIQFQNVELDYWNSASMTKGIIARIMQKFYLSGQYLLEFVPSHDGLIRRPKSSWINNYTGFQLNKSDVWFRIKNEENRGTIEKSFFFSVDQVQYNRQRHQVSNSLAMSPLHRLTIKGAKCAWTISNRDMTFAMYESWYRAHMLREQLSDDALKSIDFRSNVVKNQPPEPSLPKKQPSTPQKSNDKKKSGELSLSNLNSWKGVSPLDDMKGERGDFVTVFDQSDQYSSGRKDESRALIASFQDDVLRRSWLIEFVNCQVLLRGSETQGYLILSASKAEARKNIHKPAFHIETYLSKTSWTGVLEDMQYFATVSPNILEDSKIEEISWIPLETIDASCLTNNSCFQADLRSISVDDGYGSVGGVVSQHNGLEQLQRIVSKCKCEFYHVSYGDELLEEVISESPMRPSEESVWGDSTDQLVNCFSLVHHDLNVSTNSLQYSVVLDVINNLLLYLDPTVTMRTEHYLRTKCNLLLSNSDDQKKPIIHLQNSIRQLICHLRSKEKKIYHLKNSAAQTNSKHLVELGDEVTAIKEEVASKSEELNARLRCYHDLQLSKSQKHTFPMSDAKSYLRQKSDIFFSRAQWRLTETDGQLGIADVAIGNFSYTKSVMRDESVEHLLEMGHVSVQNLLKDQAYVQVLSPTALQNVPFDRQRMLRVFCREKPPVGGISVKDHFEVNVTPLTICITQSLYKKIIAFCFPDRSAELAEEATAGNGNDAKINKKLSETKKKSSSFYVESPLRTDDVEQMKERAKSNKLFVYIKIPEVPICLSFKGEREKKQILDVANFLLQVPTIEYHNVTWTWLDFLMAVKSKTKDSLLSQAIKQKLSLKMPQKQESRKTPFDDEEKAKLLFGNVLMMPKQKK